jgi:hypothetical protein
MNSTLLDDLMRRDIPPAGGKLLPVLDKLALDNDTAQAKLEGARVAYGNALVDEAEGHATAPQVARLKADVAEAQDRASASAAALLMAQARHRASQVAAQRSAEAAQWDQAVAVANTRQNALDALGRTAEQFAGAWREVLRLNADLYQALPAKPDMDAAFMNIPQIETALRRELLRLGVDWATSYPWGKQTLPPFSAAYEDAATVVDGWRNKANGLGG